MADDPAVTPDPSPAPEAAADAETEAGTQETTETVDDPREEATERGASITSLNSQITDAVAQANVTVLGNAPAIAMAAVSQSLAQAMSLAFLNATQQQQQANIIAQAATAAAIARFLAPDSVADAAVTGAGDKVGATP